MTKWGGFPLSVNSLARLSAAFALIKVIQRNPLHRMVKDTPIDFQPGISGSLRAGALGRLLGLFLFGGCFLGISGFLFGRFFSSRFLVAAFLVAAFLVAFFFAVLVAVFFAAFFLAIADPLIFRNWGNRKNQGEMITFFASIEYRSSQFGAPFKKCMGELSWRSGG